MIHRRSASARKFGDNSATALQGSQFRKVFPEIELLMEIVSQGAPVPVTGQGDLAAALVYGNHSSTNRFSREILEKIAEDVSAGKAFVFPREMADKIPGIRISPLTVSVSPSKVRICHDLSNAVSGSSVKSIPIRRRFPTVR